MLIHFRHARSIAHQTTGFRILAYSVYGGDSMARCQRGKLEAPTIKKWICTNEERIDAVSDKRCESSFDF